jgi:hypothetical protein
MKNSSGGITIASAIEPETILRHSSSHILQTTSRYQTLVEDWHECNEERRTLLTWILLVTSGTMKQITEIIIIFIIHH